MMDRRPETVVTAVFDDGQQTMQVRSADGSVVGTVRVDQHSGVAQLNFAVAHGQRTRDAGDDVLTAIFELPALADCQSVRAALPLGECDLVAGLSSRLGEVHARAAGVTCLIDARVGAS